MRYSILMNSLFYLVLQVLWYLAAYYSPISIGRNFIAKQTKAVSSMARTQHRSQFEAQEITAYVFSSSVKNILFLLCTLTCLNATLMCAWHSAN